MKALLLNNILNNSLTTSKPASFYNRIGSYIGRKSIKMHLALTEALMRCADTSHLTENQLSNRQKNLDLLHTYWTREEFPHNIENPGQRLPYIRDSRGVLCAMGFLLFETGEQEYVSMLTRENNHIYIKDVHEGPLFAWLETNGITKQEAMRIQPTYGPGMGMDPVSMTPMTAEPTFFNTLVQIGPVILAIVFFIFAMYITWVFVKALNLSPGKRVMGYFYFIILNLAVAAGIWILSYLALELIGQVFGFAKFNYYPGY